MEIDLHVHTAHSGSAQLTTERLIEEVRARRLTHVAVTDSGSVDAVGELVSTPGLCVVPGLELATEEGHFLIFCEDVGFLRSLGGYQRRLSGVSKRDDAAVVWAHPWAYTPDGSRRSPLSHEALTREVLPHVHAIEVCNGNMAHMLGGEMLSRTYIEDVVRLATLSGKGMVGGSDAHTADRFFVCRTEVLLDPPAGKDGRLAPAGVILAVRKGFTRPKTSIPGLAQRLDAALRAEG